MSLADLILAEPSPENLQLMEFMIVQAAGHSENLYLIHNTTFANCTN